jgi:hypothetical protein
MKILGFKGKMAGRQGADEEVAEALDAELRQALGDFRLSVHAWSEAELSRPRLATVQHRIPAWRLAAAWTFSAVLVAAAITGGGIYQYRQAQVKEPVKQAKAVPAQQIEPQPVVVVEQQVKPAVEEDLLAKVDSDVSREVPAAMEPLARLMDEGE